jgi:hypothetical protein
MPSSPDDKALAARVEMALAGLPRHVLAMGPPVRFRVDVQRDCLEVWLLNSSNKEALYRLASNLKGWGFPPDFHGPRPATEEELAGIAGMGDGGMAEWFREKGVIWYEWPIVVQRSKEDAGGAGFDDLCAELAKHGYEVSWLELSEALQTARFRNIPPGRSGHSYTC